MSELPNGWWLVSLGEIGYVQSGVGFPNEYQGLTSGDYPVYKVGDVSRGVTKNNGKLQSASNYVTSDIAKVLKGQVFEAGSTLFAKIGEALKLNRRGFVLRAGLADNNVMGYTSEQSVNNRFIYYFLRTRDFAEYSRSTTVPSIRKGDIEEITVALPPSHEQTRIAQKLDELLAQVDTLKSRIDAIPTLLKRFRQSTLAAAVSGRLTDEWRAQQNLKFDDAPSDSNLHPGWSFRKLPELGELARGKSKHRPRNDKNLFGSEYPFIQTGEVANSNGRIQLAKNFYSEFGLAQSRLFPRGTLCITIAANIADTAILDIDACFPDSIVGFIPSLKSCEALFIKYLIEVNKQNLEAFAPATAQKNINLKILSELRFPMPSHQEQTEIVRRVEQLFAFADQLEVIVASAKSRIDHLTQSILAKAFRGELVPQDPNDEPASVLLERIKAQRAAAPKAKRGRKVSA
jgi:type I restriction enzyme S subunit